MLIKLTYSRNEVLTFVDVSSALCDYSRSKMLLSYSLLRSSPPICRGRGGSNVLRCFSTTSPESSSKPTYYNDLGVDPQVSSKELKEAFYKLSKEYHPDRNIGNPDALKKFQTISEAYDFLSNPEKRIKYDKGVLGRNSSVAEREAAAHRFEGETFYGARGQRQIHKLSDLDRNLDAWVKDNKSESFHLKQEQQKRVRLIGMRDGRMSGIQGKSSYDKFKQASGGGHLPRGNPHSSGGGFMTFTCVVFLLFITMRFILF